MNAPIQLTARQQSVLERTAMGDTYKECARALGIAPETTKQHRIAVMRALSARSMEHAVAIAFRMGIMK